MNKNKYIRKKVKNNLHINESISSENKIVTKIQLLPLVLMIGVVPLIVRLKINFLSEEIAKYWTQPIQLDFYSYYKSIFVVILTLLMLVIMFITLKKPELKEIESSKITLLMLLIFTIFTIISTFTSAHMYTALWGAPERYEGMVIQLCYIISVFYTLIIIKNENRFCYIKYSFVVLSLFLSIVGISQILGNNLLDSEFIFNLMIPTEYNGMLGERVKSNQIYLTLQNPNYVGSYAALIIPFLLVISFNKAEKIELRILMLILSFTSLIILIFSKVQSGLLALLIVLIVSLFVFRKHIIIQRKKVFTYIGLIIIIVSSINAHTDGLIIRNLLGTAKEAAQLISISESKFDPTYGHPIPNIELGDKEIKLSTIKGNIYIKIDENYNLAFYDDEGAKISYGKEDDRYGLSGRYREIIIKLIPKSEVTKGFNENNVPINETYFPSLKIFYGGKQTHLVHLDSINGYNLVDFNYNTIEYIVAPHFGFEGKEKLGSGRGYIWSRSVAMIKKTLILGNGPDTFLMNFPQNDVFAKSYVYGNYNIITDKPHNMYIQFALNNGLIALGSLVILWSIYLYESLRLYSIKRVYKSSDYYGIACFFGFVGYMVAGLFNDSLVGVAPLYWIMLGCGISINRNNRNTLSKELEYEK